MPQPIVIVMVKAPRPGEVKTRLVPPLSESDAASLAACFARDTILNAKRTVKDVLVAYTPTEARSDLEAILPSDLHWSAQAGDNLGQRLDSVAEHAFSLGFSPLVILGAESPTLPTSFIRETVNLLTAREANVCLGPTEDGGYYLVGLRNPVQGLFQNIDWSTPSAYEQTAANAAKLGLRLHPLPSWYDIDTPADLTHLHDEMYSSEEVRLRAPNTYRWLLDRALHLS
ncbi:MAG TPA: TIGR04282 family arsenosugar biosynthesis glycosyltransferase [Pyrinomonadaceae bacterium]